VEKFMDMHEATIATRDGIRVWGRRGLVFLVGGSGDSPGGGLLAGIVS
jgi:hypothetical protein